jgi:hypothetical protein
MSRNPLAEVFGYPVDNFSPVAVRHRAGKLCPFHNSASLHCTKNSATDPLGVCTVVAGDGLAITCPTRLRQGLLIVEDAAGFFFPAQTRYVTLTEVRLADRFGKSAGNIDIVLVALDDQNQIIDFGALEIQAVYISGNVSKAFQAYMKDPTANYGMQWPAKNYPKPDYLSSSRKRLAPQLIYKGGILNQWSKKIAVAVHRPFFEQLPLLPEVDVNDAEIAWFVYDLVYDSKFEQYKLHRAATKYTRFKEALDTITTSEPGDIAQFVAYLKQRVEVGKFMGTPPQSELPPDIRPLSNILAEENEEESSEHLLENNNV